MTRRIFLLAPFLLLPACGGGDDGATLRGTLRADALPDSDTLYAWTGDGSDRVAVQAGAFEIAGVEPGVVTLRFSRGSDTARMEIGGLPDGGEVRIHGIRLDGETGLAFPASVAVPGGGTVVANGVRYGGALPERVEADGTVLAVSGDGDALLVRPADTRLPDLRVVVGPLTESMSPDGDPVPLDGLEAGDSVRVEGTAERGYVVASRIVGPRELALREAGTEEPDPPDDAPAREPVVARTGGGDEGTAVERGRDAPDAAAAPEPERERGRGKAKGAERGRGKGSGKKGKG